MGATRLSLGLRVRPNGLLLSRAQVSAEDTPPQPDATAEMALLSCHPPQALERLAGKPQGGVWCGMARPGWRTSPWDSRGLGSRLALVFPSGGPKPSHSPLCPLNSPYHLGRRLPSREGGLTVDLPWTFRAGSRSQPQFPYLSLGEPGRSVRVCVCAWLQGSSGRAVVFPSIKITPVAGVSMEVTWPARHSCPKGPSPLRKGPPESCPGPRGQPYWSPVLSPAGSVLATYFTS